eukprot:CAMPEP_0196688108 /NCGR_PEP_ID=MMETSP1090-20130531/15808_1 /TAXON_ID=37098 /ORGANISM="Isochrysis sp, Strain CCMP1244" /LENGTH=42 /DNA_ID= /DNA_START= /DNA_END= /DNA_ORIENTATION=
MTTHLPTLSPSARAVGTSPTAQGPPRRATHTMIHNTGARRHA